MLSINSFATSLSRMTSGLQAPVLALSLALGSTMSACSSDPHMTDGSGGDGGTTVGDGGGGTGGDGGMGGDGGGGMGPLIPGSQYAPVPHLPASSTVLPATYGLIIWGPGELPAGRTFQNYEFCLTPAPLSTIDDASECPNSSVGPYTSTLNNFPFAGDTIVWKVRSLYDAGHYSEWTAVQSFSYDLSLLALLTMDGNTDDYSGNGHSGTAMGGPGYATGIASQALSLDGVNDYVDMGSGLTLTGPLSISAWIHANGTPSSNTGIVNQGALNAALTYNTDGRVYFYINGSGNSVSAPVSAGALHHVMATFDGTTAAGGMRLYVDGVLADQRASSSATTGASGNLEIGRYLSGYFNGRIDQVSFYDRALPVEAVINETCGATVLGGAAIPALCLP
ncbi:MAG TPA: LamG domain-containing protein [bacterium]|nr:LamG domain-containing protein [bacterium]